MAVAATTGGASERARWRRGLKRECGCANPDPNPDPNLTRCGRAHIRIVPALDVKGLPPRRLHLAFQR